MAEDYLQVRLEVMGQLSGQYSLSCNSWQYLVTLNPEASIIFSEWLRRLRPVLVGHNDPAGERDPQDLLRNVGIWLWQALLPESAPTQECKALAHCLRTGRTPLLLTLPDILVGLPWEMLYDPEQTGDTGFLALRRPLMRLTASETTIAPIKPPLRVLLLISSPPSLGEDSRVDVESERASVEHAVHDMRQAGFLHLFVEDIVTPKRVQQVLMAFKPHIVHYIGHGGYSDTSGGVLLWENEQGNGMPISAEHLASLLRSWNLLAVVLHGCETATSNARAEVRGMADTLVQRGLPAILAQQANFTYESSQIASKAWYKALIAGKSIVSALLEVRQELIQADRPDWAVPILQGSIESLVPFLDTASHPGSADPQLTRVGAAADLSLPTDVFVGRHRELRALHLMLEQAPGNGPVLALITGPGGVGKSTLVAQAISRYGGIYKAVLMLRCQEYQSIDLFLQSIGEFLKRLSIPSFLEHILPDPKLSTEAKIDEAILALNEVGPILLLIDNLEGAQNGDQTVRDEALLYLLQKLLTNLSGGRVLITSRYMVKELLVQEKFGARFLQLSLDDLSPYETSQLLLRHPPLARLSEIVRQILIREFGGLPYVYDLLSSEASDVDLEQIIYEVQEYGAVKQKTITQESKQMTAKEWQKVHSEVVEFATLEIIISRLSEASRTLLAQLGILHQPFPLAAIEEGLGAVTTVWQPLLDWSLLHYDPHEQSYHLHSLTMRYAEGLLEEHDRKQTQVQLATWYEHYADQDSHDLVHYLEAHRLFRAAGSGQKAGQLVMSLAMMLTSFGLYTLLRDLCVKTLSDISDSNEQLKIDALYHLGVIAQEQGEYEQARAFHQQSLNLAKQLGDQSGQASSLIQLGIIAQHLGEYEQARALLQQGLDINEEMGNQHNRASILHQLATIAQAQGEYEQARALFQQNLELFEHWGDKIMSAGTLHQLATIAWERGEYEQARALDQQSLDIAEQIGHQSGQADALNSLGLIAQDLGEYEQARVLYQQSLVIKERLGDKRGQISTMHNLANLAYVRKEYEQARALYQQSLNLSEQLGNQHGRANTLYQLGRIAQDQGEYEQARVLYQQSLNFSERLGHQSEQADALNSLGLIAQHLGEYEQAHVLYQQSLVIKVRLGDKRGQSVAVHNLANLAYVRKEYEQAHALYQQSLNLFEQLGDQDGRANALYRLGRIAQDLGEYEQARVLYQQSLDIDVQIVHQSGQAATLYQLGLIAQDLGEYEQARALYQQSLNLFEQLGDQDGRANALYQLGRIAQDLGEYEQARALFQQSLDIAEQIGHQSRQADALNSLGLIAQHLGEYEQARDLQQQSLDLFEKLEDQQGRANTLHQLGRIAQDQGEYEQARVLYQQSLDIDVQIVHQSGQAATLYQLGLIAQDLGEYEQARVLFQQCLDIDEQIGDQHSQANSLSHLGIIAQEQGEYEQARNLHLQSLDLFEQLGDQHGRASSLGELGTIAQHLGKYEQARDLQQQSLDLFEQLGDQRERATTLFSLGNLAFVQGEYEQARTLYQQSLDIAEQIGHQSGQANSLYQLGLVAYQQTDFEHALRYLIQAYVLFETLRSPSRARAQRMITKIGSHMDEETFTKQWQALAGNYPLPILPVQDTPQSSLQVLRDFIQMPISSEAKSFLEAHLELLEPEIDALLQELANQQEHDVVRKAIEEHRFLLTVCREKGIDAAFEEIQMVQSLEAAFVADLNHLCNEVVITLRTGNAEQGEVLAKRIEQMLKNDSLDEDVQNFLMVLLAWLREQDTQFLAEKLQSPLREVYAQMVAAVRQKTVENTDKDDALTIEKLLGIASAVILQGTAEQRQLFALDLIEVQQQLTPEAASLKRFLGCLVAVLRGETPEVELLEPPFTELWQAFQDALSMSTDESSQQEEGKGV